MSRSFWRQWNLGVLFALAFYSTAGIFGLLMALEVFGEGDDLLAAVAILGIFALLGAAVFGLAFLRFRPAVWHEPERFGRASALWCARLGALLAWAGYLTWSAHLLEAGETILMKAGATVGGAGLLWIASRRRAGVPAPDPLRVPLAWGLALGAALPTALAARVVGALLTWGKLIPQTPPEQATIVVASLWLGVLVACVSLSWLLGHGNVAHLERLRPALRFLGATCAFLLPGTPQMARGRALTRHAAACLLGAAALFHLGFAAMNLSNGVATFDILEVIATPSLNDTFPSTLNTSGVGTGELTLVAEVSSQKVSLELLRPIWREGSLLAPGIHFWDGLFLCAVLYLALAAWSLRDHLRERAAREGAPPQGGRSRP